MERFGGVCTPTVAVRDPEIRDVELDSRSVVEGTLFAALPGTASDGARFVPQALERGAVAVLAPRELDGVGASSLWVHPDARRVAGEAAAVVHARDARPALVGITGTNGKSTVAHMVRHLLRSAGYTPGLIGTIEVDLAGSEPRPTSLTTPDAPTLHRYLKEHVDRGGNALVLEASSHALHQERLAGLQLDVAVYTNLGRDHLDYHSTQEAYADAKAAIFGCLGPEGASVVNANDAWSEFMVRRARNHGVRVVTFGIGSEADLRADRCEATPEGTRLFLEGMGIPLTGLFFPLVGRHNIENALAALAVVLLLGVSPTHALQGLTSISSPPGRLERVDTGERGMHVFVDYAHTPDALEQVLGTLRDLLVAAGRGRLLVVFGCGGDRDRTKRPLMGAVAVQGADLVFVTSDNPRSEEPEAIVADVLGGMPADDFARGAVRVELDRRQAIRSALAAATPHDVILIAGKGHETWQSFKQGRVPFDDRQVVREELP
ncbi:MAG: UDP-N-acetylmuramoyl-L-alanyl-D-glutamate--2,6-diaminopimelate ligase [Planctomycetota bacterium]